MQPRQILGMWRIYKSWAHEHVHVCIHGRLPESGTNLKNQPSAPVSSSSCHSGFVCALRRLATGNCKLQHPLTLLVRGGGTETAHGEWHEMQHVVGMSLLQLALVAHIDSASRLVASVYH